MDGRTGGRKVIPRLKCLATALSAIAASLIISPAPSFAQDDADEVELHLLATIQIKDCNQLITGGTAFLRGASLSESIDGFSGFVKGIRYSSNSRGIDSNRPVRAFILADDSPTNGLIHVSFIPVMDKGKAFIAELGNNFEIVQKDGAVVSTELPFDEAFPERVLFAPTGSSIIASDDFRGIRWVVERLRERSLPKPSEASKDSLFSVTIEPDVLADCIDAIMDSPVFASKHDNGTSTAIIANLAHASAICKDLRAINISATPTASGLGANIGIVAKPGTRLGTSLGSMAPPPSASDTTLPGKSYLLRCDSIPAFLNVAPPELLEWSMILADSWSFFGCSIGPSKFHWFSELLPFMAGDKLSALTNPPGIEGVANLQAFTLRNSDKAAEKLASLVASLKDSKDFTGIVSDDIELNGVKMYRITPDPTFTRRQDVSVATSFDLDAAIARLLRETTYEAIVTNDKLIVVHGPEGSLEALLPALADKTHSGDTFNRAKRIVQSANPNARPSGASVYSFANLVRAMATLSPNVEGSLQISLFPDTGDGLATLMTPSHNALRWDVRVTTAEVSLLQRIFSMHYSILQEIIVQLTLEPLRQKHHAEQQDSIISTLPIAD